ncbi:hypothetical protein DAPPUDRAFT_122787 [Daphnia pulex]|uniref:RING-type domain-containing protein n=1 Tax=Daphnia pulex TaxID=6669 RepID=E9I564_DAPPU|nr:hypothetical protein DAPPUDRAFT_122787 [Daphnia pulex]|eukprot:EFX60867.1 hypothetical protein DAPPUDRAFT_122787 [Daphnia pulex]
MASAIEDEFVTCSICMSEYNEDGRKPKVLPCSHTVCLTCLQGIFRNNAIACPYCRQSSKVGGHLDVRKLPNNSHALHILKLNQQIVELTTLEDTCDDANFHYIFTVINIGASLAVSLQKLIVPPPNIPPCIWRQTQSII